ncbi:BCD family MFS transporter [Altererythrobacter lutimaris]
MSWLPFADAASIDLPLSQLLRLALFQVSVGMATVLLNGTLNRVMIVELGTPAWLVAAMIALPLVIAPFRALIGHRSDNHRSVLGWRRVPYIWFGTTMQFGGLAIMPFALILLSGPATFPLGVGASAFAFILTGAGIHVTQTAGLALATDLAPPDKRPRAVALLYVMLLVGMMFAAFVMGGLLVDYTHTRLVQVIQGAAALTFIFNLIALWKQEARRPEFTNRDDPRPDFSTEWKAFTSDPQTRRMLVAIGLGAGAFAMQDALLEPYGGEILSLSVGATTSLTGGWALGTLLGFALAGSMLSKGFRALRIAGYGLAVGVLAFLLIMFAAPLELAILLAFGALAIGFGNGLFAVGSLVAVMALSRGGSSGIALGAWGAVQATCAGIAILVGGILRDVVAYFALSDALGTTLATRASGYGAVYFLEILLLLATLIVIGPLVGREQPDENTSEQDPFGLAEFPT